ncbi:MAG: ATP synthase subunit I [Methylococcales bacterium]|nr:ATP synthase subunit I [Methylococcales bacterium]MBT7444308.1 ATP synthase subunit I [Methylococcales bacterium]
MIAQLIIVLCFAILFTIKDITMGPAAIYGGLIAVINTVLHGFRLARMQQQLAKNPQQDVMKIMLGAVERFALTLVLMVVGLSALSLEPTALLLTFGAAYMAYFIIAARIGMAKS